MKRIIAAGMLSGALIVGLIAPVPQAIADDTTTTLSVRLAQCADGTDNDGDSLIDYPADPDCSSVLDDDEASAVVVTPECADGTDNDGDSLIDYPADPGCDSAGDGDERNTVTIIMPGGGPPAIITLPALPLEPLPTKIRSICDFNADNRCNIIDLSILLYHLKTPMPAAARYDLNGDGVIDVVDISILFYYWA